MNCTLCLNQLDELIRRRSNGPMSIDASQDYENNDRSPLLAATYYLKPSSSSSMVGRTAATDLIQRDGPFLRHFADSPDSLTMMMMNGGGGGGGVGQPMAVGSTLGSVRDEPSAMLYDAITGRCQSPDGRQGVCLEANECLNRGGVPMGKCRSSITANGKLHQGACCLCKTLNDDLCERFLY